MTAERLTEIRGAIEDLDACPYAEGPAAKLDGVIPEICTALEYTRQEIAAVLAELDATAEMLGRPLHLGTIRSRLRALVSDSPKAP